jgi:arylsulfatase A-like enzyme
MIQNVLIYVVDSLRWDALPREIRNHGVTFKTIAGSSFSAPSFATLATGRYPPHHGVYNWTDRLAPDTPTLFEQRGIDGGFWQRGSIDGEAIFPIIKQDRKTPLNDLEPPFVYLERNNFAHVPFAGSGASTARQYYATRGRNWGRMRAEYAEGVRRSVTELETRLEELTHRGLLDQTLVIVTSDHGELFGEHGEAAHGAPACPELAFVPTVFVHPSISSDDFHAATDGDVIEHVDVVQTALSAIGTGEDMKTDGTDLLSTPRPRPWGYNHIDLVRSGRSVYTAESLWWYDGGHVFARNPRILRGAYGVHQMLRSATQKSVRDAPIRLLCTYLSAEHTYGSPPTGRRRAREELDRFRQQLDHIGSRSVTLSRETNQRLRDLGYR